MEGQQLSDQQGQAFLYDSDQGLLTEGEGGFRAPEPLAI